MGNIRITNNLTNGTTPIPNWFIDQYMLDANGSYVKMYLYLLRHLYVGDASFSISDMADDLENTEKDVVRSLSYWKKKGLITLKTDEIGQISQIVLMEPTAVPIQKAAEEIAATTIQEPMKPVLLKPKKKLTRSLPERMDYTPEQITALTTDKGLRTLLFDLEQNLSQPLSPQNIQLVLYLYEGIGFSSELILYLFEYCYSKDKGAFPYMEKVALDWAKQGIDTVSKAKASTTQYNTTYTSIMKALGLNRLPAEAEKKYIDNWISYGFSLPIIIEACNRTILHTHNSDFKYTNGILEKWKKEDVRSMDDVRRMDEDHSRKKAKTNNTNQQIVNKSKKPAGQFQNFPQRQYTQDEYNALEQQLLKRK